MRSAQAEFEPRPEAVQAARRFARDTLGNWSADAVEWAASQVVSELVTNAVLHARTPFRLDLSLDEGVLLVTVHDGSPRLPVARQFGQEATTGRGLALLSQLSQEWGVITDSAGKAVWASIAAGVSSASGSDVHRPSHGEALDVDQLLAEFDDGESGPTGLQGRWSAAA